jgi:GrpB-like predicted nucleotidyltransferase (UPF0157 family)
VYYDPRWPELFTREADKIRSVLGSRVLGIEHAGSTSVPGLAAKPIIDLLLVVANSAGEEAYAPALEAAGYVLRIREPHWYEHRMFKGPDTDINLHIFSFGCPEIDRMLLFRDWLRENAADRELYAGTKLALAQQEWEDVQDYADAKTAVVVEGPEALAVQIDERAVFVPASVGWSTHEVGIEDAGSRAECKCRYK